MEEEWRDIPGYEGRYQISNLGRVRSLPKLNRLYMKMLKQSKNSSGYLSVALYKHNNGETCMVHRLVAKVFIPNPENKEQVNHIDGDKTNNSVGNLEWCTCQENNLHSIRVLGADRNATIKRSIRCIETGEVFESYASAHRKLGVNSAQLGSLLRGTILHKKDGTPYRYKSAGGLHWEYYSPS